MRAPRHAAVALFFCPRTLHLETSNFTLQTESLNLTEQGASRLVSLHFAPLEAFRSSLVTYHSSPFTLLPYFLFGHLDESEGGACVGVCGTVGVVGREVNLSQRVGRGE